MAEKENEKSAKWKFWGVLATAALGAYASVMASWINARGAKEDSVKAIVAQLNDKIIPQLQEVINKQDDEIGKLKDRNADLRERLAKLEGVFSVSEETKPWLKALGAPLLDTTKEKKLKERKKRSFHRLDLQQVLK